MISCFFKSLFKYPPNREGQKGLRVAKVNRENYWPVSLRYFFYSIALFSSPIAAADTSPPAATEATAENLLNCPPIRALKKDPESMTWSASGGWKSFDLSFVDKITRYSGAQWRGTNVGQIFCVYRGEADTSFPILLAFSTLTLEPRGGKWSENLGGYANCETTNQEDCPFVIRIKSEQGDIYQQAEKLKRTSPSPPRSGF